MYIVCDFYEFHNNYIEIKFIKKEMSIVQKTLLVKYLLKYIYEIVYKQICN